MFEQSVANNPAVTEVTSQVVRNPVVSDFSQSVVNNPVASGFEQPVVNNPVVSEFELPDNITPLQNVTATASEEVSTQPLQSINSEKKVDVMSEQANNSSNLDIFN